MELLVIGYSLLENLQQLSAINHQLFSRDGLNNNLTGIVPGED